MKDKQEKNISKSVHQSGPEILVQTLQDEKVDFVFGYPGGSVLSIFDAFYTAGIQNILPRHEQGGIHAAEGYAKASGKTGVVCVTSGPGIANTVTGLADAMLDSVPLVVLSGQVGTDLIGTNAFQELDTLSMTKSITKGTFQVDHLSDLEPVLKKAFALAQTGRKGPVVVDLPKDVMAPGLSNQNEAKTTFSSNKEESSTLTVNQLTQLTAIATALQQAKKPLLLVGGGVMAAHASHLAQEFAHQYFLPAVSTLMGLGTFQKDDPLYIGMVGMHGAYAANMALHECDFLLNIGSRFDDRVALSPDKFAPQAKIAHIDIDANEIGKIIPVDYPLIADAKTALTALLKIDTQPTKHQTWLQTLAERQSQQSYPYQPSDTDIKPQTVVKKIGQLTKGQAYVVTDVGQHQMWAAQFYPFNRSNQLITSGGLGTMGFGIPAAIGARLADANHPVVLFVGDGGFQMTSEELEVIGERQLDIKIVLFNNQRLGMVRQWQDQLFEQRRAETVFDHQPDFGQLAQAYDINYANLNERSQVMEELSAVFNQTGPIIIEIPIPSDEAVSPMILPGKGNNEMLGLNPM
ncbi:biosynthetic-type acetolactate synthase large subunit [Convivina intestini]|uniref:Acetolactate synthase n=1 Tax=Convivina intestini TaxID=1505726 RepID=A0A2U1DC17_9LACO|nr:biosynthetic-type acetolactate synthase large subunit [Convivina intestini]PVY85224.1 acetolactate synthase large subunit [Convivina intestini]CAH1852494.1 Acetolactate synthase large subunit [Convivina intestini]CAH1854609.1 Acetolactate synthase large subunit [Convivina intestini]SDC01299.1 acetolactate synthase, large subunit [Leuconostocaceae bacterium R-53105]